MAAQVFPVSANCYLPDVQSVRDGSANMADGLNVYSSFKLEGKQV